MLLAVSFRDCLMDLTKFVLSTSGFQSSSNQSYWYLKLSPSRPGEIPLQPTALLHFSTSFNQALPHVTRALWNSMFLEARSISGFTPKLLDSI